MAMIPNYDAICSELNKTGKWIQIGEILGIKKIYLNYLVIEDNPAKDVLSELNPEQIITILKEIGFNLK